MGKGIFGNFFEKADSPASKQGTEHDTEKRDAQKKKHNLIPENSLFCIKSEKQQQKQSERIIPTGIKEFDALIKDRGIESGSTILLSGGAGTGKTTFIIQSMHHWIPHRAEMFSKMHNHSRLHPLSRQRKPEARIHQSNILGSIPRRWNV